MVNTLNESYYDELMLSHRQPSRISHADGYVSLDENGEATFYYYLTDHLGDIRSVITPDADGKPQVEQANDYFPFGMSFESKLPLLTKSGSGSNKHKYNGKEEQEMPGKWLDFGFRFYDPQLARFPSIDPLADQFVWVSPYNYAENSPIANIDLWGLQAFPFMGYFNIANGNNLRHAGYSEGSISAIQQNTGKVGASIAAGATPLDVPLDIYEGYTAATEGDWTGVTLSALSVVGLDFIKDGKKLLSLPEKAGPVAKISPKEVLNKTTDEIDNSAKRLGLESMGPDPKTGKGAYVDPVTGEQRILSHPNAKNKDGSANPHGHVNDPDGQRIDKDGNVVAPESKEAHLPIKIDDELK